LHGRITLNQPRWWFDSPRMELILGYHPGAPGSFGRIVAPIGTTHQRFVAGAIIGEERHPNTEGQHQWWFTRAWRCLDPFEHLTGTLASLLLGLLWIDRAEEQRKLIAAQTEDRIISRADRTQACGNFDQCLIATRMAECIIDALEMINIKNKDRKRLRYLAASLYLLR
jgi:hypothetical protein